MSNLPWDAPIQVSSYTRSVMGDALVKTQVIAAMFSTYRWEHIKKDKQDRFDEGWWLYIVQVAQARSPGFIPCDYQHSPSPSSIFTSQHQMCLVSIRDKKQDKDVQVFYS